jgi:biopolymer transport protein ExbD
MKYASKNLYQVGRNLFLKERCIQILPIVNILFLFTIIFAITAYLAVSTDPPQAESSPQVT